LAFSVTHPLHSEAVVVAEHYPYESLKKAIETEALNSDRPRNSKKNGPTGNYNSAIPSLTPNVNTIRGEELGERLLLIPPFNYVLES